ncbi:MAG: KH domain-containing protein [Clostridia bacterium]|nr:KH domain-containing protein [Clostridia bacterium]
MKELVEYLVKGLVDEPDQVRVSQIESEQSITLELTVAPADVGKVIGKQGRIVKAIRTLVKAASVREGKKVMVEIM